MSVTWVIPVRMVVPVLTKSMDFHAIASAVMTVLSVRMVSCYHKIKFKKIAFFVNLCQNATV